MYNELVRVIATAYPDVHYDDLSFVFPPYVFHHSDAHHSSVAFAPGRTK